MSKKTSPSVGPTRRPRRAGNRPAGQSVEVTSRPGGRIRRTVTPITSVDLDAPDPTWQSRLRKFLPVALWPNGLAIVIIIAVSIIALLVTSTPMAAMAATVAQSWLVINAAPVVGLENTIGFLPLLPASLLALAVSARVHKAIKDKVSLMDLAMLAVCILGVPAVLTLIAALTLIDAAKVYPVAAPNIFVALGRVILLHFLALVIGMGIRLWRALARRFGLPEWLVDQAVNAAKMLGYALIVSVIVLIGSIVMHYQTFVDILALYQGWGAVAVIIVSLLYLPNMAIATLSVSAGGEFVIGNGLVTIFNVVMVPLPPLPLMAALPSSAHPAAVVLLVIAPLAAVLALVKQVPKVVEVTGFVLFTMLFTLILAVMSSGQLGIYGRVGSNVFLAAGFMGLWAFVVGIVISVVGLLLQRRQVAVPAAAEPDEISELEELEPEPEFEVASETAVVAEENDLESEAEPDAEASEEYDAEPLDVAAAEPVEEQTEKVAIEMPTPPHLEIVAEPQAAEDEVSEEDEDEQPEDLETDDSSK